MGKWLFVFGFVNWMRCIRSVIRCVCYESAIIVIIIHLRFEQFPFYIFSNRKEQTKTFLRLIENENYAWYCYSNRSHSVCEHVFALCVCV